MTRTDTTADPLTELTFEIERFEWTAADRLEVTGRWFGVRGQRFVRPTLHLRVDGRRRRLIALLDHKPWSPDTDDGWTAAFAWRGEPTGVEDARLEVSTDIVLDLPTPGADVKNAALTPRPRPKREPRRPPAPRREPPSKPPPAATAAPPAPAPPAEPVPPPTPAPSTAADVEAVPAPEPSTRVDAEREPPAPAVPAHAPSSVTAEIAALALERRLFEERAEREALAHELAEARQRIEALSTHHDSAVARAQEIVDLEGRLAVANARADAAQAHVTRLERELARVRVTPIEVDPLPPRTPRRRGGQEWDARTKGTAVAAVGVALIVLLIIVISVV